MGSVIGLVLYQAATSHAVFVAPWGSDSASGRIWNPVKSIGRAVAMGREVRIFPGVYRETVHVPGGIDASHPTVVTGLSFWGDVVIDGSAPSSSFSWRACTDSSCAKIPEASRTTTYEAPIPSDAFPEMVVDQRDGSSQSSMLPLARTPNGHIADQQKYHEWWWTADGSNDSTHMLTDTISDPDEAPGNLTSVPDATGATAVMMDGGPRCGAFLYASPVVSHDSGRGTITLSDTIGADMFGNQETGIGPFTKYYMENAPGFLDSAGEWYADPVAWKLYFWPPEGEHPSSPRFSIGQRREGIVIDGSHIRVKGLTVRSINDTAATVTDEGGGVVVAPHAGKYEDIRISNVSVHDAGMGIYMSPQDGGAISGVSVKRATIRSAEKSAVWAIATPGKPESLSRLLFDRWSVDHTGFRYNNPALMFVRTSDVYLGHSRVTDVAGFGIHFTGYEKDPGTIRNILVEKNEVIRACENASACSALKFFGGPFVNAVARYNVLRDTLAWSYCEEAAHHIPGFGIGIFVSNASGVTIRNNATINNSSLGITELPRQIAATDNRYTGNIVADSPTGLLLDTAVGFADNDPIVYATRHDRTRITGNVFIGNDLALSLDPAHPESVTVDRNIYGNNRQYAMLFDVPKTFQQLRLTVPNWERHSWVLNGWGTALFAAIKNILF